MMLSLGIKHKTHMWKGGALATAPTPLPKVKLFFAMHHHQGTFAVLPFPHPLRPLFFKSPKNVSGTKSHFVKLPTTCFGKPIFISKHVFKVTKNKITVKFDDLNPRSVL